MIATKQLYGVSPRYFKDLKYEQILTEKIRLAKIRIDYLTEKLEEAGDDYDYYAVINENIMQCKKAIRHNEFLLQELKQELKKG